MDFVNFFVIVGLIVLFSNIQKRRKRARRDEQEAPAERRDVPVEETRAEERAPRRVKKRIIIRRVPAGSRGGETETTASPSSSASANAEGGYDYEAFRKKLRKAWKMPEDGAETSTDGVYRETKKHDDCAIQKEMRREPTPERPRDIRKAEQNRARQAAAKPSARPSAPKAASVPRAAAVRTVQAEKSVWEKKPVAAVRAPAAAAVSQAETPRVWSEKDVRQWMIYDAVFGEPRARRPWTPRRRA